MWTISPCVTISTCYIHWGVSHVIMLFSMIGWFYRHSCSTALIMPLWVGFFCSYFPVRIFQIYIQSNLDDSLNILPSKPFSKVVSWNGSTGHRRIKRKRITEIYHVECTAPPVWPSSPHCGLCWCLFYWIEDVISISNPLTELLTTASNVHHFDAVNALFTCALLVNIWGQPCSFI